MIPRQVMTLRSPARRSIRQDIVDEFTGNPLDHADDERVSHHERSPTVEHPHGPIAGEAIEALKFARG